MAGAFALSVIVVVHILEFVPAAETVGGKSRIIATVEVDGGHVPLEIVHWKIFVPGDKPVTPEVANVGVVIAPPPEINVHKPLPTAGVLPAKVADEEQTVCVVPALEIVGF